MKNVFLMSLFLLLIASDYRAAAQTRIVVRDSLGRVALQTTCLLLNCHVGDTLDGTVGNLFLITAPTTIPLTNFLSRLLGQLGIVDAEVDATLHIMQSQRTAPSSLLDEAPLNYYGATVWHGYVNQPAAQIIDLQEAQSTFNASGQGIVAVIDTGVAPDHPALQGVLLPGRDFTRNRDGGSETADVDQSTMGVVNGASPAVVNQSTMAVVNQDAASNFSQSQFAAFGHGTMVTGIIHLVAPTAQIMPLKAFHADGTGNLSDVLRAIYYATQRNANVLNMSFDVTSYSRELDRATTYATGRGVVCVASAGNDGQQVTVYPAGLSNVIGVASTANDDTRSSFSNFGQPLVWVAAPGEGIVTTYPFGTYAAGWGTSFSAPLVTGTVALLRSINTGLNQEAAAQAVSHAKHLSADLGNGRLDVFQAAAAW